jgi:hypothetical protein
MDWEKEFEVENISDTVLIADVLTIYSKSKEIINPGRYPERTISGLQNFHKRGLIKVTNDFVDNRKKSNISNIITKQVETTKDPHGGKHSHIVLNGGLDTGGKAIETGSERAERLAKANSDIEEYEDATYESPVVKTVEVKDEDRMTREEAVELLSSHWKRVESEVNKINDARKLNFLLVVAIEEKVADKKREIIEEKLNQI